MINSAANPQSKLSIDKFVAELNKTGLAKTNLFVVEFHEIKGKMKVKTHGTLTASTKGSWETKDVMHKELGGAAGLEKLALFVQGCNVPSSKISTEVWDGDRVPIDMPKHWENGSFDVEFLCDATMTHRHFFQEWMANVINPIQHYHGFYDDYTTNIVVKMFDNNGGKLKNIIEMTECYPIDVSAIDLKYGPDNSFAQFKVTFTYRHRYEVQCTNEALNINELVPDLVDGLSDFESLLSNSGFSGLSSIAAGIGGIAKTIGSYASMANGVVGRVTGQIDKVRAIQSTVTGTINKVRTPISNATSGKKDALGLGSGIKNSILNVIKR